MTFRLPQLPTMVRCRVATLIVAAVAGGWGTVGLFAQPQRRPPDRHRTPPVAVVPADDENQQSLDDRLTSDAQLTQGLKQVETFVVREKWPEVVAGLQLLVEGRNADGDTFTISPAGRWTSLQRQAHERIRTLPAAGLRLYQEVYGGVAADLLSQARRNGDLDRLVDIARRFLNTEAGEEAAVEVALTHFDRAEYLAAVRWFDSLTPERRARVSAVVQIKYALALSAVGRAADAERVIAALPGMMGSEASGELMVDSLAEWWQQTTKPSLPLPLAMVDWPVFQGNPTRTGFSQGGAPLLLEQWSFPMTFIPAVQEQLRSLQADLRDAGRACIPAAVPVIVGNRVAVRTLRGVEVLDLASGSPLWAQAPEPAAPDRLLSGTLDESGTNRAQQMRIAAQARYSAHEAGNFDQHPLTGLLYQDTVNGTLSSDGRRLYVLTQHAVLARANQGYWIGPQQREADPFHRDWSSNVITAYELETGAELWQVGGSQSGEPFDRPLAGTYFFGTPTPADDELYVIGERDNEITLFVLDQETGQPVFKQPLANAQARIDSDAARRMWACLPAISNGVVVCPTTTGWTVAVERRERRLLWAHFCGADAADTRRNNFRGAMMQPIQPLNVRWETSPPIISGRRVVVTPPELPDPFHNNEPVILCLDVETGRELWRQAKQDDGLYVGGVVQGQVLIVGKSRLRALSLADGSESWTVTLPVDGPPSGRGLVSGGSYVVPLANGQLWTVQLSDGEVSDRLELNADQPPLGNLAMSRGLLVSVDPLQVRSFNEQSALEAEIARRRVIDANDLWSSIREAELARMRGDRELALRILQRSAEQAVDPLAVPELTVEFEQLRRECLASLVESDPHGRDVEFALLARNHDLRSDPQLRRLAVERGAARGDAASVWPLLWPPVSGGEADRIISRGALEVRTSAWEAGQLELIYGLADADERQTMDADIGTLIDGLLQPDSDATQQQRVEQQLAFHPQGQRLIAHMAEQSAARDDFAGAEIRWRRLYSAETGLESWRAGLKLANWLAKFNQPLDVSRILADVKARIDTLADSQQVIAREELATASSALGITAESATFVRPDWTDRSFDVSVKPRGQQEQIALEVPIAPGAEAFYEVNQFRFQGQGQLQGQAQRLRISNSHGEEFWSLPLRSQRRPVFDQTVGLRTDGLQAYSIWQGVIQALSMPDRKVRWSFPLDVRLAGSSYVRNVEPEEQFGLLPADQFVNQWNLRRYRSPTGMAAVATPDYVLLHGRRAISLIDALTGTVRWTRKGVSPQTMVYGDGSLIYGFPSDGAEPFVLRAVDGNEQPHESLLPHAGRAVSLQQGVLTVVHPSTGPSIFGLFTPRTTVSGIDVASGETLWKQALDGNARVGWLSPGELLFLDSRQHVAAVDVVRGTRRELGILPGDIPRDAAPVQRMVDSEAIYLLFDRDWRRQSYFMNLPHQQINGFVVCVARDGSGVRWHRRITEQRLLRSQFAQSPVLTFFNQLDEENLHQLQIEMWDKRTGRPLLESNDLRVSQQTFQLDQDFAAQTIRFLGQSLQVVIGPSTVPIATTMPATVPSAEPAAVRTGPEETAPLPPKTE